MNIALRVLDRESDSARFTSNAVAVVNCNVQAKRASAIVRTAAPTTGRRVTKCCSGATHIFPVAIPR